MYSKCLFTTSRNILLAIFNTELALSYKQIFIKMFVVYNFLYIVTSEKA